MICQYILRREHKGITDRVGVRVMVARTNQLNFTKVRDDCEELCNLLQEEYVK